MPATCRACARASSMDAQLGFGSFFFSRLRQPSFLMALTRTSPRNSVCYIPTEVKEHCVPTDCWFVVLGTVFDLSDLLPLHPPHLVMPLLLEAGGDISHWFHSETGDVKTRVDPISKLITCYTPQGRFIHVPPHSPRTDWDCSHELPWWKDPKYMIGKLSKKTRCILIKNVLTTQEALLEVPSEENVRQILERYLSRNAHANSYTWKAICATHDNDFTNLDMELTLTENGVR